MSKRMIRGAAGMVAMLAAGGVSGADFETLAGFIDTEGSVLIVDAILPGGQPGSTTAQTCEITPGFAIDCPGDATANPGLGDLFAFAFAGRDIVFDAEFPVAITVDARGFAQSRPGSRARTAARTETQRPFVPGMPATPARQGVFFELVPNGGEQPGDYVEVIYSWTVMGSAAFGDLSAYHGGESRTRRLRATSCPPSPMPLTPRRWSSRPPATCSLATQIVKLGLPEPPFSLDITTAATLLVLLAARR